VTLQDNGVAGTQNTDAGEILIFTDPTYPGLAGNYPPALSTHTSILNSFVFSDINLQEGNNPSVVINFHGLNVTNVNVSSDLRTFAPAVFWQDQWNSCMKYTSNGNIDITSCGGTHTIDDPCTDTLANSNSPASLRKSSGVMHIVTPLPTPAATRFSTRPRIEL